MKVEIGDKVRLTKSFKEILMGNGSHDHAKEFGDSLGIVEGPCYPNGEGDELDVRWQPSGLRYGYPPSALQIIEKGVL